MANVFKIAVILLTLSVDWSQCYLVGKMVLWERDDPVIRYTNDYFVVDDALLSRKVFLEGDEQCLNNGLYHPNHGCMCRGGFYGEQCNSGRERRETGELQLACHKSLDASELGMCNCDYSERSNEVMYCKVEEGQTCIIPQEHLPFNENETVDDFRISVDRTVIVPLPSGVCHPHLDYTNEPHPRPVIINMDGSLEGVVTISAEVFSSSKEAFDMEIIFMLEPVVRTLPCINASMGSDVVLPCSYDGEVYIVYWNRGDDPLSPTTLVSLDMYRSPGKRNGGQYNTGHYNITDDFSLLIKNVTMEDAGRYYCEVVPIATGVLTRSHTDVSISENHLAVDVSTSPTNTPAIPPFPECFMTPSNTALKEGDAVTLTCRSTSENSHPQLVWINLQDADAYISKQFSDEVYPIHILSLILTAELQGAEFVCMSSHRGFMEPRECTIQPLTFEVTSKSSSEFNKVISCQIAFQVFTILILGGPIVWLVRDVKSLPRRNQELLTLEFEILKRKSCNGEIRPMLCESDMNEDISI